MLALIVALYSLGVVSQGSCRFALQTSCQDLLNNSTARSNFLNSVIQWESKFHTDGVGYNSATGFTYDGHPIDYNTGELAGSVHDFSATSKESIHVGLLARAVAGDPLALNFVGGFNQAITILTRKMNTYESFNTTSPGYGGFLPWVSVSDSGIKPTTDWCDPICRVPALDNGEWAWSLYGAWHALEQVGGQQQLATRYKNYFELLTRYAKTIFYQGNGQVRAVAQIFNTQITPVPSNYAIDGSGLLDDPYEGELFTWILDLYANWDSTNGQEREQLWYFKRPLLNAVNFTTPQGNITVQKGWWFSAHEQWKIMMLPYYAVDIAQRVFLNGERARTWNSYINNIPGLYASVNDVTTPPSIDIPDYVSATGVQPIAFQPVERTDIVTPYGSFPMFMDPASYHTGLCWYQNMLAGPRCQGPYGSTEAVAINGTEISPLLTWDSKITTVLAMLGGVTDLNGQGLKYEKDTYNTTQTRYDRFTYVIAREYGLVFPSLSGESIPLQLPPSSLPNGLNPPDFSSCQRS